jgi:Protein of unknown function (DUF2637)
MHPSPTANATTTAAPGAVAIAVDAAPQQRSADRLIAAIRVALVAALTALVLAIAALAYVVSFEAIRAFAVETAAFPAELAWSAPLLVDSFTTAASLVILWRYLGGDAWSEPWYAWSPAPPPSPWPSTSPTPLTAWPRNSSRPCRRSRCWGRWSC